MEQSLVTAISTLGFSTIACVFLWKTMLKKDEDNRMYTNKLLDDRVGDLKKEIADTKKENELKIEELKQENKEDKQIYQFVSKENIINGKGTPPSSGGVHNDVYIKVDPHHAKPTVLITRIGFIELVSKSNMPQAQIFQHWMNNEVYAKANNITQFEAMKMLY